MGGTASEREVSLRSGAAVAKGLRERGFEVTAIDVRDENPAIPEGVEAGFIALHGAFGEDGGIQRVLERRGIPYTGSGPESSAHSFDKRLTRAAFLRSGIPVCPGCAMTADGDGVEMTEDGGAPRRVKRSGLAEELDRSLRRPLVVKPACEGSSIGLRIVNGGGDLDAALDEAFSHGPGAVAERFVAGRELTVGLVNGEVLPELEICAAGGCYDFAAKYETGETRYLVPAPVEDGIAERCRELAERAFRVLGARGFGRVDFRMDAGGELYALELNSIPGFTETSLLPKAAAAAGVSFAELCERIMNTAVLGEPGDEREQEHGA
ncbi:D-alanine--D-alanine ligase B [Kiritimatiella glycovorans]|uniref:D-alanine--D-alanine ligase n=2 Tax=Kiritimatiella glycovorans TaxID=1307763 RepID=A0A0G3EBQ7_9BACT|nr:D-alanine--D-alanine ligase B [Kiritimatiella glycovorans]